MSNKQLNQHSQSIPLRARLNSIKKDAEYIRQQAERLSLPVVANERCGSWYVPPDIKSSSVYFKSTDGHKNEWAFSLRRLNLHLLPIIGNSNGCIVVDSCRRGKHMSDALSKTIPIWCVVLNRLLFPNLTHGHELALDKHYVLDEEASEIRKRLAGFLVSAKKLQLDLEPLRSSLKRPLMPIWLVPDSSTDSESCKMANVNPVYLCRASKVQNGNTAAMEPEYVQGAGDDAETWSRGLTPEMLWSHCETLLATSECDLPALIDRIVKHQTAEQASQGSTAYAQVSAFPQVHIDTLSTASIAPVPYASFTTIVICASSPPQATSEADLKKIVFLKCAKGKPGSRDLRTQLKRLSLQIPLRKLDKILICGHAGQDLALGVALALICRYGDDRGALHNEPNQVSIDKAFIKRRLAMVTASMPTASISRVTLNVIHEHLMPRPIARLKNATDAIPGSIPQKRKAEAERLNPTPAP